MKKRVFTIVALATILGLLVTGTAAAGSNRTAFTGTYQIISEGWPERYWEPGRNISFWRGMPFVAEMTATDSRVTGIACISHNGNYRPSPDDPWFGVQGQMWGTIRMVAYRADLDCTVSPDYWEGTFVGDRAPNGNEYIRYNLKGNGTYKGLQLRFEAWSDPTDLSLPFTIAGEVSDPGGKQHEVASTRVLLTIELDKDGASVIWLRL
jgi:hypothetical protein